MEPQRNVETRQGVWWFHFARLCEVASFSLSCVKLPLSSPDEFRCTSLGARSDRLFALPGQAQMRSLASQNPSCVHWTSPAPKAEPACVQYIHTFHHTRKAVYIHADIPVHARKHFAGATMSVLPLAMCLFKNMLVLSRVRSKKQRSEL